jgi:FKBP-type peptidyl-prolyl cis-trans isomerase
MPKAIPLAVALILVATLARAEDKKPTEDRQKTLYAIGLALARNLEPFEFSPQEFAAVKEGLEDGFEKKPKVSLEEQQSQIQALVKERQSVTAAKEKTESDAFLSKAAGEKGVTQAESGLIFKEVTPGSGKTPAGDSKVRVHYEGTLRDGTVFDSSRKRGQPAEFALNQVIPCWTEALQKMKVGGKARVVCPAKLAYGDRGAPPVIKPGSALVFDVELLEVLEADAKASGGKTSSGSSSTEKKSTE